MRDSRLTDAKNTLRVWFAVASEDYLARVLIECREKTFAFNDQCHCVRGLCDGGYQQNNSKFAMQAERALADLCGWAHCVYMKMNPIFLFHVSNHIARQRIVPMVLREIRNRQRVADQELELFANVEL